MPDMQGGAPESSDLGLQVPIAGVTQAELQLCHRLLAACLKISFLWEVLRTLSPSILCFLAPPNPGVVGASPHAVQIQVEMGHPGALASRAGKGIYPCPSRRATSCPSSPLLPLLLLALSYLQGSCHSLLLLP